MKRMSMGVALLLVGWMWGVVGVYFLVTVPPNARLATMFPQWVWTLREWVYPWFFSPAIV